ncbi:MAG: hypothetical protein FWE53_04335 [Firmicutes bacterium]|nr:hypothetical protein [Bacillota bacterium]
MGRSVIVENPKQVVKRLKEKPVLTAEEKQQRRNIRLQDRENLKVDYDPTSSIGEDGKEIIVVKLADHTAAYQQYSNRFNLRLNPDLYDYIKSENDNTDRQVHIKVYNDVLIKDTERRELFKETLKSTCTFKRMELMDENRHNTILGFLFLLISVSVIVGGYFIEKHAGGNFFLDILPQVMFIVAWVFGWGATEKLIIDRVRNRRQYRYLVKLACADVSFYNMPPSYSKNPNSPEDDKNCKI